MPAASQDQNRVTALVHDANVILSSDTPANDGRERDLDLVKEGLRLAEKILNGAATDEDRAAVAEHVKPAVRTIYGL